MANHTRRRIGEARSILDLQALNRIGVVACPDLRHIIENTKIEASTAAGAALEENVRKILGQAAHQLVNAQHLAVRVFQLSVGRKRLGAVVGNIAVAIPFDIGDVAA